MSSDICFIPLDRDHSGKMSHRNLTDTVQKSTLRFTHNPRHSHSLSLNTQHARAQYSINIPLLPFKFPFKQNKLHITSTVLFVFNKI